MKKLLVLTLLGTMVLSGCSTAQKSSPKLQSSESSLSSDMDAEIVSMKMLEGAKANSRDDFKYVQRNGETIINDYIGDSVIVVIPDEIDGCPVVKLSSGIFSNNDEILAVKIGDNITYCEDQMFINCTALQYVILGEKVETLGDACFVGCINLEEVKLNDGLKTIKSGAFGTMSTKLEELKIPESVTEIGEGAFQENTKVYVKSGSYAETYIKEYVKTFTQLEYVIE